MKKKKIKMDYSMTLEECFDQFLMAKKAKGVVDKTIQSYKYNVMAISKHLLTSINISELTSQHLLTMIESMRNSNLSDNSIKSYVITMRAFINWSRENGLTDLTLGAYNAEETIKETYTKEELKLLLKKPNLKNCPFSEYRNWVIINLLVNNGCRAATIRSIKIGDNDFKNRMITARHTKNKKPLVIPLCSEMIMILHEYLKHRDVSEDDYLFCTIYGGAMNEDCLRQAIEKYNKSCGVTKQAFMLSGIRLPRCICLSIKNT